MADHFSGPRALADPASDITDVYAFPSPERPGYLVLVLDVFPIAAPGVLFSDALTHRFRLRPVTATTAGGTPAFVPGADEWTFDTRFAPPAPGGPVQAGTCTTPSGAQIPFRVGDEQPTEAPGLRIFAGQRLDPFFLDLAAESANHVQERLTFTSQGVNTGQGANCLTIVVEFNVTTVLGSGTGPLFGVVGETLASGGGRPVRLERMGRPEIKNFLLQDKKFDPVNRDLEIRDLYNTEDTFAVSRDYIGAYRARLNANLAFFDRLDGAIDWPPNQRGDHPLTDLLLGDFLVVDTSKPFTEGGFLEIERAVLAGRPHTTCGGRPLNDDIVDILYTLLVGGVDGPPISDGVDQATRPATRTFPYLVAPNPEPPDLQTVFAAASAPPEEAAPSPA
jgi:hypothetical protein